MALLFRQRGRVCGLWAAVVFFCFRPHLLLRVTRDPWVSIVGCQAGVLGLAWRVGKDVRI